MIFPKLTYIAKKEGMRRVGRKKGHRSPKQTSQTPVMLAGNDGWESGWYWVTPAAFCVGFGSFTPNMVKSKPAQHCSCSYHVAEQRFHCSLQDLSDVQCEWLSLQNHLDVVCAWGNSQLFPFRVSMWTGKCISTKLGCFHLSTRLWSQQGSMDFQRLVQAYFAASE